MSFLSAMLPTLIGAGVTAATGGAAAPWVAAGLGAIQAKRTGSLQKGIMAGLSAYGGSQLASGLMGAGTAQASGAIGESAALAGEEAAQEAIKAAGPKMIGADLEQMTAAQAAKANVLSPDVIGQSAREFAANSYMPTAAQSAALNTPLQTGLSSLGTKAGWSNLAGQMGGAKGLGMAGLAAVGPALGEAMTPTPPPVNTGDNTMPQRLRYNVGAASPMPAPDVPDYGFLGQDFGRMQSYYPNAGYQQITPEQAKQMRGYAGGGMAAGGGPVEMMSDQAAIGTNTGYPMANMTTSAFATPYQDPRATSVIAPSGGASVNQMTGELNPQGTRLASGGLSDARYNLGGYSDGGRLLRGPGDGVSDSIPAMIGEKQPARLADGEFVVPARIVSELGNGSTEAGARRLYAMMDRVQKARGKTVGKGKVAKNTRADRFLPA